LKTKIGLLVTALCLLGAASAFANTDAFKERAGVKFKADAPTEVTVRVNQKAVESNYNTSFVPIRLFSNKLLKK
jgi:hypothetical protein